MRFFVICSVKLVWSSCGNVIELGLSNRNYCCSVTFKINTRIRKTVIVHKSQVVVKCDTQSNGQVLHLTSTSKISREVAKYLF